MFVRVLSSYVSMTIKCLGLKSITEDSLKVITLKIFHIHWNKFLWLPNEVFDLYNSNKVDSFKQVTPHLILLAKLICLTISELWNRSEFKYCVFGICIRSFLKNTFFPTIFVFLPYSFLVCLCVIIELNRFWTLVKCLLLPFFVS